MSSPVQPPIDPVRLPDTQPDSSLVERYAHALRDSLASDLRARTQREVTRREREERQRERVAKYTRPSPPPRPARTTPSTVERGGSSEARAADHLIAKGYTIVARNVRYRAGELDLVALDGATLVFVEVRSRGGAEHGHAAEMVDVHKRRQVARVAQLFLSSTHTPYRTVRFDVIAVTGFVLDHIEDAWRL